MGKYPSRDGHDRSQFSQERYKFFLDAPFEISNHCCSVMKKHIGEKYTKTTGRVPITAQTASESRLRTQVWLRQGCNAFESKKQISNPMSFWTEQDVLAYIRVNDLKIASLYGEVVIDNDEQLDGQINIGDLIGYELFDKRPLLKTTGSARTGCFACGFGCHREKSPTRFELMSITNPKLCDWIFRGGKFDEDGLWKPYKGLGYWFVFEWCNVHGNLNFVIPGREYYLDKYSTEETDKYLKRGKYANSNNKTFS